MPKYKKPKKSGRFKYIHSKITRPKKTSRASTRLSRIERKKKLRKLYFVLGIIIILGFFYLFFFSPVFKIKQIVIERPQKIEENISDEEIKDKIQILTYKFRWLFFPQKNIFVLSKKRVRDEIQNLIKFEELKISKNLFKRKINITIKEKQPALILVCQKKYYLFASDGKLIKEVPPENRGLTLVYYHPEETEEEKLVRKEEENGGEIKQEKEKNEKAEYYYNS